MKKLLSFVLATVLVLGMGNVAFAADYADYLDKAPVVSKNYEINNGTAPAETFNFSFTGVSYKDGEDNVVANKAIPAIADVSISFDAISATLNKTVSASINANSYDLGVYTYKVTETVGNTAGVTYSNEDLYLVLTILRDENSGKHYVAAMHYQDANGTNKSTGFTNKYDSGSLTVTKNIAGNMADMSKKFNFTITFTAPTGKVIRSTINSTSTAGTWSEDGLTYTIALGHNDSVTLSNIPAGVTYTVTEDAEKYTSSSNFTDTSKTISAGDTDAVTFTNTLTNEVDTGITMDSIPYILMLAIAFVGLVAFFGKKRMAR